MKIKGHIGRCGWNNKSWVWFGGFIRLVQDEIRYVCSGSDDNRAKEKWFKKRRKNNGRVSIKIVEADDGRGSLRGPI